MTTDMCRQRGYDKIWIAHSGVKHMLPAQIMETVTDYLKRQPEIAAAYVIGSVARDTMQSHSDVDISVLFSPHAGDLAARFERRLELEMALQDRLRRRVQVVDFDAASIVFRYQIMKTGKRIIDGDPAYRVKREAAALGEYLDFKPTYDYCLNAALRRIDNG